MVDWGQAARIGVTGFLTVFVVLGILSLVLWGVSSLLFRLTKKQDKNS